MRIPYLLLMLILLLAGGAAGYLKLQSQVVSPEWQGQVESQLNELVAIDSRINEQALKNRYALSVNYDLLAKLPVEFEKGLSDLTQLLLLDSTSNQHAQKSLQSLKKLFVNKSDILENFKSHNSILLTPFGTLQKLEMSYYRSLKILI